MKMNKHQKAARRLEVASNMLKDELSDLEERKTRGHQLMAALNPDKARWREFWSLVQDATIGFLIGLMFIVFFVLTERIVLLITEEKPEHLLKPIHFFEEKTLYVVMGYLFISLVMELAGRSIIKVQQLWLEIQKGGRLNDQAQIQVDPSHD